MKKITKGIILTVCALAINSAFAQDINNNIVNDPSLLTNNVQVSNQSSLAGTEVLPPNSGNVYEKETTPLLREYSRKKAILELRRLDSEIDKVDNEILARQVKADSPSNTGKLINAQNLRNEPFVPQALPAMPTQLAQPPQQVGANMYASNASSIRVLSVQGFDDNLYAKISNGEQGGYVVKKGDVLPNGQQVVSVNHSFVEVRSQPNKKTKTQKIYVTGPELNTQQNRTGGPMPTMMPFNDGTTSFNPNVLAPISQPRANANIAPLEIVNSDPNPNRVNGTTPTAPINNSTARPQNNQGR